MRFFFLIKILNSSLNCFSFNVFPNCIRSLHTVALIFVMKLSSRNCGHGGSSVYEESESSRRAFFALFFSIRWRQRKYSWIPLLPAKQGHFYYSTNMTKQNNNDTGDTSEIFPIRKTYTNVFCAKTVSGISWICDTLRKFRLVVQNNGEGGR